MLDAVDKVIIQHIRNILSDVGGKDISVFSIATADTDDQPYNQAGQEEGKQPDRVEFPFVGVVRAPDIDITDYNMTKRVHNYTGYKLSEGAGSQLTYYRCTLHYLATVFAENRKVSEDIATALYGKLRNYCQVSVLIRLPIEIDGPEKKYAAADMDVDIELGPNIKQVVPMSTDKAQVYKARITFDVKNVNVYHTQEERSYKYNVFVEPAIEGGKKGPREQVFPSVADKSD